ncbi:MAG: hypothetical protein LC104_05865 [Bacteroidales bacterium]|nr:hypothetical protein [Bacteroidales bacterium]
MLSIHVRINDQHGKPTPVRVRFTGPDGVAYTPAHRAAEFPTGRGEVIGGHLRLAGEVWHTMEGTCEIRLPASVPIRVQATKGPEYQPLDQTVTLGTGQMALRFTISRWADESASGWISGDNRVHGLSPHDAALDGAAEGLGIVQLLARVEEVHSIAAGRTFSVPVNMGAFSGQQPARETHGTCVAVNTLNQHPLLGTVGLLHAHRPVYPLSFGGSDASDDWSISAWCDQCHRKRGLTVWVNAFEAVAGIRGGEALIACILGKMDALEVGAARKTPLLPWCYRLWNAGYFLPLIGGSGHEANSVPLGSPRTYARIPTGEADPLTSWAEAIRSRQVYVTNGPLLRLQQTPVQATAQPASLSASSAMSQNASSSMSQEVSPAVSQDVSQIEASAASIVPFERLELVHNGIVIASVEASAQDGRWTAVACWPVPRESVGWYAVRCLGGIGHPLHQQPTFAHSAPVLLDKPLHDPISCEALRKLVQQTRDWLATHGQFAESRRRQEHLDRCDEALARLPTPPQNDENSSGVTPRS